MTDSFDPQDPKSSRRKPRREPATIDLEAKAVDEGRRAEQTDSETERLVSEAMAETEATLDSGAGTDSIAAASTSETAEGGSVGAGKWDPPSPPPRSEPSRLGSLVGAGLIGGVVGAGLVYGLQIWQKPPVSQDSQRLAQLEQRVSALGQPASMQGLETRLKALEDARSAVDRRLQAAESAARQAEARSAEALNRPVAEAPARQDDAALKGLSDRLAALEEQTRAQVQATQQAGGSAQALEQAVQSLDNRVAENDKRVAALSQQVGQGPDEATLAALRLSLAARLNDALRRGVPYANTLAALQKVSKDSTRLAPLAAFAQEGAPTAEELSRTFTPLRAAILRDDRTASGSWTDRLWRMADRVVTVRPVSEAGATGVPGIVARIDKALENGNVTDAAAAWQSLPEPSRRLSEEWGRQAKARAEAEAAAQAAADDALSTLPTAQQ